MSSAWTPWLTPTTLSILLAVVLLYLHHVNRLLASTPTEVRSLSGSSWTADQLRAAYAELEQSPVDFTDRLPSRLDRRYIVTGGSGLVGGYIVLQLLARGTPTTNIRIVDIRRTERGDMLTGPAAQVDFAQTDITSEASVDAAFNKPWPSAVAHLPLTVFHTAAVIIPSNRSKHLYAFPENVNVNGTRHVLAAARRAGADVFSSTSSASISIRPVEPFVTPWTSSIRHFWQFLDDADFSRPLRPHEQFFGNYPASKAVAERLVCAEDDETFRTGCIRPANGVYGNATDNTVGDPLSRTVMPTWVPHIVQSFVHGANVAIAHLHHEAALLDKHNRQSGRPFVVTDPNPPITYGDLYTAIRTLSVHPFRTVTLPPVLMLLLSHAVEWYILLPYRYAFLRRILPELRGDIRHLQPGIFSITTHLIGSDADARRSTKDGGLGYQGVLTTMQGMVLEIMDWNREHASIEEKGTRRSYTTSVNLAEKIEKLGTGRMVKA